MELEIEIKGKTTINISESVLKTIVEEYKGNYEEYLESYPIDKDSIDWDFENKEYETENLLVVLNKYRIDNGYDANYELPKDLKLKKQLKKYLFMESIEQLQNYHLKDKLEEFKFDKVELDYISSYADEHNPKEELNFIYFDKENIVATDTRVLVCNKNNSSYFDIYIPKIFCEAYCLFDEVKIFFEKNLQVIYLVLDGKVYKDEFKKFKFVEYKRIIPNSYSITLNTIDMIGNSRALLLDETKGVRAFAYKLNDNYLCANLNKIHFGLEFIGINKCTLPFVLFDGNKERLQVIMPLILSNDEVEEYLK